MSAPDPKTVREIARKAAQRALRLGCNAVLEDAVREHWPEARTTVEFYERRDTVRVEYDLLAERLSWPDEQQPAEATGGDQAQDGAAGRVEALLKREPGILMHDEEADLRAVLAERDALAARVAELESERGRYRIAWRLARQRARVAGWAADKYAKRSRDLHEAAMDMLTENLGLKMFGPEAVAEADRIAALTAAETEES